MCWALLAVAGDTLVARMAKREFRSQSMGMYNSIRGISSIAGSLIGGLVAEFFGYLALFVLASVFILSAIVLLLNTEVEKEADEVSIEPSAI
jgi:MFS family permease